MPSIFTLPQQTFCLNAEVTEGIFSFPLNTPGLFETTVITTVVHCEWVFLTVRFLRCSVFWVVKNLCGWVAMTGCEPVWLGGHVGV